MDVNDLFWGYEKNASHSAFSVSAEMDKRPWLSSSFSTSLAKDFKSKRSSASYSLWTRSAQLADRRDQIRPLHCLKHSVFCTVVLPFTGVFINSKTFSSFVIGVLRRQNAMMSLPCDFKKIILFKFFSQKCDDSLLQASGIFMSSSRLEHISNNFKFIHKLLKFQAGQKRFREDLLDWTRCGDLCSYYVHFVSTNQSNLNTLDSFGAGGFEEPNPNLPCKMAKSQRIKWGIHLRNHNWLVNIAPITFGSWLIYITYSNSVD